MTGQVRLTVVPDEGAAEMVCGSLRTEQITCYHRVTECLAPGQSGMVQFWGWREIVVNVEDLPRAREILDVASLDHEPAE